MMIMKPDFSALTDTSLVAASSFAYDGADRLASLLHRSAAGGTVAQDTYSYDWAGRITGMDLHNADGSSGYNYDANGQLLLSDNTARNDESYSYDDAGNRTGGGYSTGAGSGSTCDRREGGLDWTISE